MGRGKSYLEESHELQEGTVWTSVQGNGRSGCEDGHDGGRGAGVADCGRRRSGDCYAKLARIREAGETNGDNTRQILLQHQGADAGGAGASQAIERKTDGGAEADRGVGERVRIPVWPGGRIAGGIGGLGGGGEQVLPVF